MVELKKQLKYHIYRDVESPQQRLCSLLKRCLVCHDARLHKVHVSAGTQIAAWIQRAAFLMSHTSRSTAAADRLGRLSLAEGDSPSMTLLINIIAHLLTK